MNITEKFIVYGRPKCQYCVRAMELLDDHGMEYDYTDIMQDEEAKRFIKEDLGATTVPQIFYDDNEYIGGYNELIQWLSKRLRA